MGWLFRPGYSRRDMIADLVKGNERSLDDGTVTKSTCLAHCYRGGVFSGVLWTVWERTFRCDKQLAKSTLRWINCDVLRYEQGEWGYKDIEESMHPYFYSCPLSYLALVPLDQFGGKAEWREGVREYHRRITEKRRGRKAAKCI
jgi:hypothetical protein